MGDAFFVSDCSRASGKWRASLRFSFSAIKPRVFLPEPHVFPDFAICEALFLSVLGQFSLSSQTISIFRQETPGFHARTISG